MRLLIRWIHIQPTCCCCCCLFLCLLSTPLQADQEDTPESTYQATFDTSPEGDWTTVRLPWASFVPVKRAQSDPKGAPLDPSRISKLGLVLSRCALTYT
jgi:hypothetical protein